MSNNADMTKKNMERYRSGHNGAVLKTVCLHGRMGSNPILSASKALMQISAFVFLRAEYEKWQARRCRILMIH